MFDIPQIGTTGNSLFGNVSNVGVSGNAVFNSNLPEQGGVVSGIATFNQVCDPTWNGQWVVPVDTDVIFNRKSAKTKAKERAAQRKKREKDNRAEQRDIRQYAKEQQALYTQRQKEAEQQAIKDEAVLHKMRQEKAAQERMDDMARRAAATTEIKETIEPFAGIEPITEKKKDTGGWFGGLKRSVDKWFAGRKAKTGRDWTAPIDREPVVSSYIDELGYDDDNGIMEVEFHDGAVFRYDVPHEQDFNELVEAPSIGQKFYYDFRTSVPYKKVKDKG